MLEGVQHSRTTAEAHDLPWRRESQAARLLGKYTFLLDFDLFMLTDLQTRSTDQYKIKKTIDLERTGQHDQVIQTIDLETIDLETKTKLNSRSEG